MNAMKNSDLIMGMCVGSWLPWWICRLFMFDGALWLLINEHKSTPREHHIRRCEDASSSCMSTCGRVQMKERDVENRVNLNWSWARKKKTFHFAWSDKALAWKEVTNAVNAVSSVNEASKRWSRMQKKKTAFHYKTKCYYNQSRLPK